MFIALISRVSNDRKTSGSLEEEEMLWEHEPIGECLKSFSEFSQTFSFYITRG